MAKKKKVSHFKTHTVHNVLIYFKYCSLKLSGSKSTYSYMRELKLYPGAVFDLLQPTNPRRNKLNKCCNCLEPGCMEG